MIITVVYDNDAKEPFLADWGFSCLIESKIKILFDTGANSKILEHNLSMIDVDDFDYIFLSHEHYDHIGGLNAVIDKTSYVLALKTFSKRLKDFIKSKAELIEVVGPFEFEKNFITTGILGRITKEQSLLIETERGFFVITGCSHPGLDNILRKAEEFGKVIGVMGGFHGFSKIDFLRSYELVIPCHCTYYKDEILKMENSKPCFAGCSFEI